jgi:hypothetical protein
LTFHDALQRYIEENIRERRWTKHTRAKHQAKFDLMRGIVDPDNALPLARLGAENLRRYKAVLYGLSLQQNQTQGIPGQVPCRVDAGRSSGTHSGKRKERG